MVASWAQLLDAKTANNTAIALSRFKLTPALKSHQKAEGVASSFTVVLPHNSLLVMWEGCQEAFRHEVPPHDGGCGAPSERCRPCQPDVSAATVGMVEACANV